MAPHFLRLAVLEEVFGHGLFWTMVIAATPVTLVYLYFLVRDSSVNWRKFIWTQLSKPGGSALAVWFVVALSDSQLANLGRPVEVIVFLAVGVLGAIVSAIFVSTVESFSLRVFGMRRRA